MPRKKNDSIENSIEMAAINFRCKAELKASLEDLAASCRQDVSAILIELVEELIAANQNRIEEFRKAAATPIIKPTFATPSKPETSTPKKTARTPRKKKPAQMDGEQVTNDGLKEGDGNAENS